MVFLAQNSHEDLLAIGSIESSFLLRLSPGGFGGSLVPFFLATKVGEALGFT